MMAQLDDDHGGLFKSGNTINIGYLDQEFKNMDPKQSVMDFLWEANQNLMEHHVISHLIRFGFDFSRINDKIEKLRELSINITTQLVERFDLQDEAQAIIPGIVARMNKIPYSEPSEEVRIEFLKLLELLLDKDCLQFVPQLSDVSVMVSKILLDNNPEMKNKASAFCVKL
jgi:hypothetical protein